METVRSDIDRTKWSGVSIMETVMERRGQRGQIIFFKVDMPAGMLDN